MEETLMTLENVILDQSIAGLLLFISQLLRARIRLFQKRFIPASMIAGVRGLFLGSDSIGS